VGAKVHALPPAISACRMPPLSDLCLVRWPARLDSSTCRLDSAAACPATSAAPSVLNWHPTHAAVPIVTVSPCGTACTPVVFAGVTDQLMLDMRGVSDAFVQPATPTAVITGTAQGLNTVQARVGAVTGRFVSIALPCWPCCCPAAPLLLPCCLCCWPRSSIFLILVPARRGTCSLR